MLISIERADLLAFVREPGWRSAYLSRAGGLKPAPTEIAQVSVGEP